MNKIRKGDEVIVSTGPRQGQARHGESARDDESPWSWTASTWSKKHVKPNPMKGTVTGGRGKGHADPPVQRGYLQWRYWQG